MLHWACSRWLQPASAASLLEESDDAAVWSDVDLIGGRDFRETGHGHDVATDGDDEFRPGGKADFANRDDMMFGCALLIGIRRETVLRFGDADGKVAVTLVLKFLESIPDFLITD